MPDISMCDNTKCPVRKWCYRYRAISNYPWQSYCHYEPKSYENIGTCTDQCEHFWSIKGYEHRINAMKDIEPEGE